jgi:hypothetical protein
LEEVVSVVMPSSVLAGAKGNKKPRILVGCGVLWGI